MPQKDFRAVSDRLTQAADDLEPASPKHACEQAHIQAVRDQINAIGRGDLSAALAFAHDDIRLDIYAPPEFPWIRHAQGPDDVRHAIANNFGTVDDQRPEILNVVAQEDTVVLLGRETGIIRATGEVYEVQFVERFTFRDGRLAAVQIVAARS